VKNVSLSFRNARFMEKSKFVGFQNYINLFKDPRFWNSVIVLLKYTVLYTVGIFIVGFVTAILLNSNDGKSKSIFRTIFVLPYAIPDVVAAMVFLWMLDFQFGITNHLLMNVFHLIDKPIQWLGASKTLSLLTIVMIEIWRQFPLHTLLLLASMQDVPAELYEAASLDGAGRIAKFLKITIPHMSKVIMILLTLTIIWSLRRFTMIWLLTQGGPNRGTETIAIQIYNYVFQFNRMSYGAAIGVVLLLVTSVLLIIYMRLQKNES
jgi:multiple sugar transport system permease protein